MWKNRIKETDIYDGSETAKQRLLNLFLYTDANISEFCDVSLKYRKYIAKTLNALEEKRREEKIENFSLVKDKVLRITEIDNIQTLNRLFFNVLASFDAFINYLYSKKKGRWVDYPELKDIISILQKSFKAKKLFDENQDYDIQELLCETRNSLIHNGKFVSKFASIESGIPNVRIPALVIIPSEILTEQYCEEHNIAKDHVLDTYEVFSYYRDIFDKLDKLFLNIFKAK